jgi:hypothetical protein
MPAPRPADLDALRQIRATHPGLNARQIARKFPHVGSHTAILHALAALDAAPEPAPEPEPASAESLALTEAEIAALIAMQAAAPRARRKRAAPPEPAPPALITCPSCGRDGTPSRRDPSLCVACGISPETAEARRAILAPPLSPQAEIALAIAADTGDKHVSATAWRHFVRARAADGGLSPEGA